MENPDASNLAVNACSSCKHGKRKCDRVRPRCSTCVRISRTCVYEGDSIQSVFDAGSQRTTHGSDSTTPSLGFSQRTSPRSYSATPAFGVDPFRYETLRRATVDIAVRNEALNFLGGLGRAQETSGAFFKSIYIRIPIVSAKRFYDRLPSLFTTASADFVTLCLCIDLIQQFPVASAESMQSTLYVTVKSIISLLEATNYASVEVVQSRLLVTFYEMGHGIYPAAFISMGACARVARDHRKHLSRAEMESNGIESEERRRVWWAVLNLDRYISLCNGDPIFGVEDPASSDILPTDDSDWAQSITPRTYSDPPTLGTPASVTVGPFARESQVSHLAGRVARHLFDPTSDFSFQAEEAAQLQRTLLALMPLLIEEEQEFGQYCVALGMCASTLFTLYDSAKLYRSEHNIDKSEMLSAMEPIAAHVAKCSWKLFSDEKNINYGSLSPFVPFSLYQAAVVYRRLLQQGSKSNEGDFPYADRVKSFKQFLEYFSRRWQVAGKYLKALSEDEPPMMVDLYCASN